MYAGLNKDQFKVASKLIFEGLSMAKNSMEKILQCPISLEKFDYLTSSMDLSKFEEKESEVHVIKTELMSDLKGTSHLIFLEKEVNKLYQSCLPANIANDNSNKSTIMKLGFLTEIDNIVSAAFITEFSNHLGVEIYGGVPSLKVIKANEIKTYLSDESNELEQIVHFKVNFEGKELDISPDFIWTFNNKIIDKFKNLAE